MNVRQSYVSEAVLGKFVGQHHGNLMNPAWNVYGPKIQGILGEIADSDNVAGLSDLLRSLIDKPKGGHFL